MMITFSPLPSCHVMMMLMMMMMITKLKTNLKDNILASSQLHHHVPGLPVHVPSLAKMSMIMMVMMIMSMMAIVIVITKMVTEKIMGSKATLMMMMMNI